MISILVLLLNVLISLESILCRDFYIGMFKRHDYLVAQDNVYRAKRPFNFVQAEYGRSFKCPITYIRVVDRIGMGSDSMVKVKRGGLLKKYIAIRIKSAFNLPVSVNVYIGCENKEPSTTTRQWITAETVTDYTLGEADNTLGEELNNTEDGSKEGLPVEVVTADGNKPVEGKPAAHGDKLAVEDPPAKGDKPVKGKPTPDGDKLLEREPPAKEDPLAKGDPPAEENPSADGDPPAEGNPSANGDSPADGDPPANEDPAANEDPPASETPQVNEQPPAAAGSNPPTDIET